MEISSKMLRFKLQAYKLTKEIKYTESQQIKCPAI